MELIQQPSSSTIFSPKCSSWIRTSRTLKTQISCLISANGYSFPRPFSTRKLSIEVKDRKSVIAEAKKKKDDSHSFVAKPDEATGPFPESVLLKEKKVQEDGRVLPEFADADEESFFEYLNLQLESDVNAKLTRHYEVVYLIHEDAKEEVGSVNAKVEEFIKEKKGKVWRFSDWGLRRLVYKIQKANYAHYILMNFELEAKYINHFKSLLDKDERVIRHLVIKRTKAITEPCPPPVEYHTLTADEDGDEDEDEDEDEDDMDFDDEGDDEEWDEEWEDEQDWEEYEDDDVVILNDGDEIEDDDEQKETSGRSPGSGKGKEVYV